MSEQVALQVLDRGTGEIIEPAPDGLALEEAYRLRPIVQRALAQLHQLAQAIDHAITSDMEARGASERRWDDLLYELKAEESWQADAPAMRADLLPLVAAGELTAAELEAAVREVIVVEIKADHRVLNKLIRRGAKVREAIARHRHRVSGPTKLKVREDVARETGEPA